MEENFRFGFWVGRLAEVVDISVGAEATDDGGAGSGVQKQALVSDGDCAVVADTDAGLLAPDEGPPRAGGGGAQDGAFLGEGLVAGGAGSEAEFAVDFMLVDVGEELVEETIGAVEFAEAVSGQEGWKAFLPVVMAAFDFAFGLWGGGIAEFDAVEVEGLAELGEGVGDMGEEEGVKIHIEDQGQAVGLEDAR